MESKQLTKVMHGINTTYAKYFVDKYETTGHLWQDRFKSYVIQKDEYCINCITYVEYNPIRANLVARPEYYQWSSYNVRILGTGNNKLLDPVIL
jgi:putative transposase